MRRSLRPTTCRSSAGRPWMLAAALLLPIVAAAQGTPADYARADGLRERLQGTIVNAVDRVHWIDASPQFWYRRSAKGGWEYLLVDADAKTKRPAFDQARLATTLTAVLHRPVSALRLPFLNVTFVDSLRAIEFADSAGVDWRCKLTDYSCARADTSDAPDRQRRRFGGGLYGSPSPEDQRPRGSPDGKWEALVRNYNVVVRPTAAATATATNGASARGGATVVLSSDGSEEDAYSLASLTWSPDSRRLAAYRVRPGYQRELHYVESSPEDQIQPKHSSRLYSKPGDVLDAEQPVLFDLSTKQQIVIDNALFPNAYEMSRLEWRRDGRHLTFEYNQRGHQVYRVIEVDAATGAARAVIDERMPTFFEYSGKRFRYDIGDGREIVWMSERDGWNHLYLYDGATGTVKNQITRGPWVVRGVDKVDTLSRQIWFTASGMYPGKDPYFVHAYRINFDGTGLTTLTQADAMHLIAYSDDMRYIVDGWSRVDQPPVTELRRTSDQGLVMDLEHADASALFATGWRAPEVFTSTARDGKSDIWGIIIRPTHFDPKKKYPVIENIYAGPHGSFVPKIFGTQLGMQATAELGFIVVQIDGMGTSNRSKAFHDVAWKNLKDAGFPDRILWHKAVAAKYPWYDISRVGIYGTSAGGQSAMGALLFHPDFYKAAVSAAGCHDNRMDKIWWNEQWMGWPIGPEYAASSNVDNAHLLQGRLLLVVGEMDRNVDPSSTMQVVNALIKSKKTFDLLYIPGADHGSGGDYGERKRWDFFVHNLLGTEPPDRNAPAPVITGAGR
jgi:dipeptidyl aminopeptidase/acylaminoacyl peptidase